MKNFLIVIGSTILLFGILVSISAYLGRDLIVSLQNQVTKSNEANGSKLISRFALVSDTHSDTDSTNRAVRQIKNLGLDYVVHTGDWTNLGTRDELLVQKKIFDSLALPYWGVMGDRERWQSGEKNFESVFGKRYDLFEKNGIVHILIDSSDIYNGLGEEQLDWLERELVKNQGKKKLIFMQLPPYHPSSNRTISSKAGFDQKREDDTARFLRLIDDQNVLGIFSGDHHLSASYTEPKTSVRIIISGAVTSERNLQSSRWSLVEVYDNGFINVSDQVIN